MSGRRPRRTGILLKLLPVSLVLLAIPWVAGRYFERFAEFVLAGLYATDLISRSERHGRIHYEV